MALPAILLAAFVVWTGAAVAAGDPPDPAVLLAQASTRQAASDLRQSDSLVWRAVDALRTRPSRSAPERIAALTIIIRCARPVTSAHADSVAAWTAEVMGRPASDFPAASLGDAWFVAGRAYQNAGRLDSLKAAFARAVAAVRARPEHTIAEQASLLARIAMLDLAGARSRDMLERAPAAVAAWRAAPGADSMTLALASIPLARVHAEAGRLDSARTELELARSVLVRRLGPDHGELIHLWRTVAAVRSLGDDPRGGLIAIAEALRITTLTRPPGDTEFINQNMQACALASAAGELAEACRFGRMAVEAAELRFGHAHSTTASAHLALANALKHVGDFAAALAEARDAVEIQRRGHPGTSGELAYGLSTLGSVELQSGDFAAAYRDYGESARLRASRLGPDHMLVQYSLGAQAEAAIGLRRYAEAVAILHRVARSQEASGLLDQLADTWITLASAQLALGHADSALTLADRVVAMVDTVTGPESEPSELYRTQRVLFLRAVGRTRDAFDEALELSELTRRHAWWLSAMLSEREALTAAERRSQALSNAVELALAPSAPPDATVRLWEEIVRSRALVFRIQAERRRRRAARGEAAAAFARVDSVHAALAHEVMNAPVDGVPARRDRADSLRRAAEDAERALGELVPAGASESSGSAFATAVSALGPGERLVAFTRFRLMDADRMLGPDSTTTRHAYAALVTGRDLPARIVALGDAEPIEERVARWNMLVARGAHDPAGEVALARRTREAGSAVRRVIWDPLAPLLRGAQRVDVVADGAVGNVNFAALPLAGGAYLAETGPLVSLLATEQDLAGRVHDGRGLLAVGAPDYGAVSPMPELLATAVERSRIPDSLRLRFSPLPASGDEASDAVGAWSAARPDDVPPRLLLGSAANERAVCAEARARGVVHLATHGFMVDGESAVALESGERGVGALTVAPSSRLALAGTVDWTVSGLALAGANASDADTPAAGDGYLTGAEIAALDLGRVRCALLSACRTGAVRADRFESLQGLERALRLAGVGSVVMSLWPVADADARAWMAAFYRAWLVERKPTADAVRAADLDRLRALRAAGEPTRPARWAPFFVRGERE